MATDISHNEEPGNMATDMSHIEEPGNMATDMSHNEKPGNMATDMSDNEEPGNMETDMSHNEKPGNMETDMSHIEEPGNMATDMSHNEKPGNMATDTSHNEKPSSQRKLRKVLGVELAPLSIPLHRRLETFAVSHFTFCFLLLGPLCILLTVILLFTRFYWVTLLSYAWLIYDRDISSQGGRRVNWCRRWQMWKHMANFFPARLHKTVDLDPSQNYLMGFHPHGIMAMGAFVNFSTEGTSFSQIFPGITSYLCMLKGVFLWPYAREYLLVMGLCDVSRGSLDFILGKSGPGNMAVVVVGGAKESLEANPHIHRLYISKRKGFIREAIKTGAFPCPIYSFGESDVYDQVPSLEGSKLRKFQTIFTKVMGFAPPVFKGRGFFNYSLGLLPYRRPIDTVVGKPIPVRKIENPSREEIDEIHQKYIQRLQELFDENKTKFGINENVQLEII
ncbi:2-acylglycerol O-acyltransferase 2-like [Amphiura filiformis]|uniref:2-acylglycerol O-acyltransferase 2-like n=1 Tax=Amphiura filiformis TaxID=82378 RepID=UPI003B214D7F